ncbi:MAG TPA: hypothetical protein VFA18_11385, partial [Gemmataceae bacterium]|nr:hypothetical protein [Gemmataceae bacterium]
SLLRHKRAVSPIEELTSGHFHDVLDDTEVDPARVRRVVLCSGKVYYDLLERRLEEKRPDVALVRVEQLYPFPVDLLRQTLERYGDAKEWVWAQEESLNMGAWTFMEPRLRAMDYTVKFIGRDTSASPATGSHRIHAREQKELVTAAISGTAPHLVRAVPSASRLREWREETVWAKEQPRGDLAHEPVER